MSKELLCKYSPQMMEFFKKKCTSRNLKIKHTNNYFLIHGVMPSIITQIACKSRQCSGSRSLCRCTFLMTYAMHAPKRFSYA